MASILPLVCACLICPSLGRRAHGSSGIHQSSNVFPDTKHLQQSVRHFSKLSALSSLFLATRPGSLQARLLTPTTAASHHPPLSPRIASRDGLPTQRANVIRRTPHSSSMRIPFWPGEGTQSDGGDMGGGGDGNKGDGGGDGSGGDNDGEDRMIPGSEKSKQDEDEVGDDEHDKEDGVKNVLIIMSDTGGGHKASGKAIAEALKKKYGDKVNVKVLDIWTEYGAWPFNTMVPQYRWMAKHPMFWRVMYEYARFPPTQFFTLRWGAMANFGRMERCFKKEEPDMIISVHPLCQHLPLRVASYMHGGQKRRREKMPYVTVVTDLAECHSTWFHKKIDEVIVPSDVVKNVAERNGIPKKNIHEFGLPIRPGFKPRSAGEKSRLRKELGLDKKVRTALVVGGGDGIGKLEQITKELASELSTDGGGRGQVVVVCGKNEEVKSKLENTVWPENVQVTVKGFVSNMDELMGAADCIVTKAGPGTIAEATAIGLPIMLSDFLPGQEAGNVPFVVERGIGAYSKRPDKIAKTVSHWLRSPNLLKAMAAKSKEAGRPKATEGIAGHLGRLLFEEDEEAVAAAASKKKES